MIDTAGASVALPLGELVRRFRAACELSQEQLAERAGISVRTVSDIECGVARAPRAITLSLVARALRLDDESHERLRVAARPRAAAGPLPAGVARANRVERVVGPRLIGRERELADLRRAVIDENVRLITLVGPAGVGKSALALVAANELARERKSLAAVVELAALSDAAFVPTKVALTLGLRDVPGESVLQTLTAQLNRTPTLLVLDTLEHLAQAAAFVTDLLAAVPSLVIVVTSRAPLRVSLERALPVGPLAVPTPETARRVQELGRVPSVRLLVERACAVRPTFSLTSENAAGVAALARVLDGLPLAIELAAPRLKIFSPAALAQHLERRLLELDDGPADLPARQRTLRGALAWSYALLPPDAQRLFRRLGVFAGPFDADAAARMFGAEDGDDDGALAVLRLLSALIDQNLLGVDDREGDPSFAFTALVRQYALELLAASREHDDASRGLFAHALALAKSVSLRDPVTHDPMRLARIERQSPNFDAVFTWARTAGDIEAALQLATALWGYWWLSGTFDAGLRQLRPLLARAEQCPESVTSQTLCDGYREAVGLCEARGELDDADVYHKRALAIIESLGDRPAVAQMLNGLGVRRSQRGDYAAARESFEEAVHIRREGGDPYLLAQALCDFGFSCANEGAVEDAHTHLEEALTHFRTVRSDLGSAAVLSLFAVIAFRDGDNARAESFAAQSASLAQAVGHAGTVAFITLLRGRIAVRRGAFETGVALLSEALEFFIRARDESSIADLLDALAAAALGLHVPRDAARLTAVAADLRTRHRTHIVPAERSMSDAMFADLRASLPPKRCSPSAVSAQPWAWTGSWRRCGSPTTNRQTCPDLVQNERVRAYKETRNVASLKIIVGRNVVGAHIIVCDGAGDGDR